MSLLPYRENVCILLFNREGRLFLGERIREPGAWQFPQGGVEAGSTLEENVVRELEEEVGVATDVVTIVKKLEATHRYDFAFTPDYAKGRFRGQSQTFWLVRFLGEDAQIQLDRHDPEFRSWRWATPEEVRVLAERRRIEGYRQPLEEFERFANEEKLKPW